MTCELILLRHAQAEAAAPGQNDLARRLSAHGEREADATGAWLKLHAAKPARILVSNAERAQATAARVRAALGSGEIVTEPGVYEATPGELIKLIELRLERTTLLVVGHNPGLEQLVAFLNEGRSEDFRGLPTAGVAWLAVPASGNLEPGAMELRHFWSPSVP